MGFGDKPNVLFILGDDWEWSAYPVRSSDTPPDMKGYANGARLPDNDAKFQELFPSIRKHMVEEGLTLNRHYAASVCTPSRKQLLTGRSVATQNNGEWQAVRPRYTILPEKLKGAGYKTHMIGKYHLGSHDGSLLAHNRGFDHSIGFHFSGFYEGASDANGVQDAQGYFDWSHGNGNIREIDASGNYFCEYKAQSQCNAANHHGAQDARACATTNWYDLFIDDDMPDKTSPVETQVNWAGYDYIHSADTHMPDDKRDINRNVWQLYKDREGKDGVAAGDMYRAKADLADYEARMQKTRYAVKTIHDATVDAILQHTGPDPFFIYASTPAMRYSGNANDAQLTRAFRTMYEKIEACDNVDPDAATGHYELDTASHALRNVVGAANWPTVLAAMQSEFCTDAQKQERFKTMAFASSVDDLLNASVSALYQKGLWDNTILIFSADNGAWSGGNAFNWPLRGGKK